MIKHKINFYDLHIFVQTVHFKKYSSKIEISVKKLKQFHVYLKNKTLKVIACLQEGIY